MAGFLILKTATRPLVAHLDNSPTEKDRWGLFLYFILKNIEKIRGLSKIRFLKEEENIYNFVVTFYRDYNPGRHIVKYPTIYTKSFPGLDKLGTFIFIKAEEYESLIPSLLTNKNKIIREAAQNFLKME